MGCDFYVHTILFGKGFVRGQQEPVDFECKMTSAEDWDAWWTDGASEDTKIDQKMKYRSSKHNQVAIIFTNGVWYEGHDHDMLSTVNDALKTQSKISIDKLLCLVELTSVESRTNLDC